MGGVQITVPAELLEAAGVDLANASGESAKLLALELYREDKVSLGRAAELCNMALESFMVFAGKHNAPIHYGVSDLEHDGPVLEQLSS